MWTVKEAEDFYRELILERDETIKQLRQENSELKDKLKPYVQQTENKTMRYTKEELDEELYDADPDCKHELDPNCYSGIKCLHCSGWFCY